MALMLVYEIEEVTWLSSTQLLGSWTCIKTLSAKKKGVVTLKGCWKRSED